MMGPKEILNTIKEGEASGITFEVVKAGSFFTAKTFLSGNPIVIDEGYPTAWDAMMSCIKSVKNLINTGETHALPTPLPEE